MKTWDVILKDGSDWVVRATSSRAAIKKCQEGRGRCVGQYARTFRTDRAEVRR